MIKDESEYKQWEIGDNAEEIKEYHNKEVYIAFVEGNENLRDSIEIYVGFSEETKNYWLKHKIYKTESPLSLNEIIKEIEIKLFELTGIKPSARDIFQMYDDEEFCDLTRNITYLPFAGWQRGEETQEEADKRAAELTKEQNDKITKAFPEVSKTWNDVLSIKNKK